MRHIHQLCHWICRKQEPREKRADDEARWGSMLTVFAGNGGWELIMLVKAACVFAHSCWSSTLAVWGLRAPPPRGCLLMLPQVKRAKTMRTNERWNEWERWMMDSDLWFRGRCRDGSMDFHIVSFDNSVEVFLNSAAATSSSQYHTSLINTRVSS